MTRALVLALFVGVTLSGCLSDESGPEASPSSDVTADPVALAPLPENFSASESVLLSMPISDLVTGGVCGDLASGTCFRYPLTLPVDARVVAVLSWRLTTNDFDLYLVETGRTMEASETLPPGTSEMVGRTVAPGEYELLVAAYLAVQDTFTLDVSFEHP